MGGIQSILEKISHNMAEQANACLALRAYGTVANGVPYARAIARGAAQVHGHFWASPGKISLCSWWVDLLAGRQGCVQDTLFGEFSTSLNAP